MFLAPPCETRPDVKSFDLGLLQSFPSSTILTNMYIEPFDHLTQIDLMYYCMYFNVISVVEFQRWWVLKSKLFAQESTCSKEFLIPTSLNYL